MGKQNLILDDVKTKQLVWFGHFQRMADRRWPKQVLVDTTRKERDRKSKSYMDKKSLGCSDRETSGKKKDSEILGKNGNWKTAKTLKNL
jgi:hypothetical protein